MGESKTDYNYQSVNEQSGIFAGDEGFQVSVNGNTNLTGAAIASGEQAIQNNANSLTTQTLTTSNIANSAEYEAEGYSVAAGVGYNTQANGLLKNAPTASAGISELSDDSNSVTVSGISGGTVNITDNTQQQALTGQDATTTVAMLNRDVSTQVITNADGSQTSIAVDSQGNNLAATLNPIFDQAQVQSELDAQIQITQAFSQVAPKAVANFANNQYGQYMAEGNLEEAAKWDEGGIYRVALHTVLGGLLTGDLSGALGAGAVAGSADLLNQLQSNVVDALQNAGLSNENANTISQALAELTSLGIGSVIGGTAGAATALVVDTNNRQLHPTELQRAKDLYQLAKSKGLPYTLAQIEDALRAANNSEYGETVISNIVYNPNAPEGLNAQSNTDMYTGQAIDIMADTNGAWVFNPQTGSLVQSIPTPSSDLVDFVQTYTGGSNSVYSWDVGAGSGSTIANTNTNPFGEGWSYMGANSTGLSTMIAPDTRTQAQIEADQARIGNFALGTVMTATGVGIYGLPSLGMMVTGTTVSGSINAGYQYVTTPDGDINYIDVTFSGITGGLTMGQTLVPSLLINTGGAITGAAINNQSVTSNAGGAALGTLVGYSLGSVVEQTGVSVLRVTDTPSWVPSQWSNFGVTVQDAFIPSISNNTPQISGAITGSTVQEAVSDIVKNNMDGK
jgi:filamentous hemagglutinin